MAICYYPLSATAQFSNGAVIVTVPSDETAPAISPKPTKTPKAKKSKPRRKRTAASRPRKKTSRSSRSSASKVKIAVLVNDDPITEFEITQRAATMAGRAGLGKQVQGTFRSLIKQKSTNQQLRAILQRTIKENQGRSREQILAIFERRKKAFALTLQRRALAMARKRMLPGLRRKATQALVDERLKLQAAKKAKVLVSDSELKKLMVDIARRNRMSPAEFKKQLKRQGTDLNSFRSRIRAQASWGRLINAKFGRFVNVNQKTIDESVGGGSQAAKVSLKLHRFIFKLPAKLDQRAMAKRMVEAEPGSGRLNGGEYERNLLRGTKGVAFRDLGFQVVASMAEPTRSLLLNSGDQQMLPPVAARAGVILYAVCGRRSGNKSFAAQAAVARNLRQKGTEVYGRKFLSDLRRDAHIEYRTR